MKHLSLLLWLLLLNTLTLKSQDSTGVFKIVEVMPAFPTGDTGLYQFIRQNIQYPELCIDSGIEGKVYVRFVVSANGTIRNAEVLKGVCPLLNDEAARVVNKFPAFIPGKQQGKNVDVYYTVPINFVLPGGAKAKSELFTVLSTCDVEPKYPGGDYKLEQALATINLPKDSTGAYLEGQCSIGFVVDVNGKVNSIKVVESSNSAIDKPAMDVVWRLSKFKPAMLKGNKVSAYLLVKFNFANYHPVAARSHKLTNPPSLAGGDNYIFNQLEKEIKLPPAGNEPDSDTIYFSFDISEKGIFKFCDCSENPPDKVTGVEKQIRILLPQLLSAVTPATENGAAINAFYNLRLQYKFINGAINFNKEEGFLSQAMDIRAAPVGSKPPEYPGGDASLLAFLAKNIRYPQMERDNDIQGKVLLGFIVDEQGKVTELEIKRSVTEGLDKEAMRVVSLLQFTPGLCNGKGTKFFYNAPIVYKLQ